MHKEEKAKYSYVLEGQSQRTFTTKRLRTEEHIFEGSLIVENLVEPSFIREEDTHVICDNGSDPLLNASSENVENVNIVANSDDHESATMATIPNLNPSSQLLRWIRFHCSSTLWMFQSNQF